MTDTENRRMFSIEETFAQGQPWEIYRWFREHDPVHVNYPGWPVDLPAVFLFRFEDVMQVLRSSRVGVESRAIRMEMYPELAAEEPTPLGTLLRNFLLFRDPPDHTRLRKVANQAFLPRNVQKLKPEIERLAEQLVTELRVQDSPVDLISHFTYPLPVLVIGKILGIPDVDLPKFREWAKMLAGVIDFDFEDTEGLHEYRNQSVVELYQYLARIVELRAAEPQDDLLSQLVHAETEDGRMTREELVATAILLLFAGHETTTNLIGNGTWALQTHPDQWEMLRNNPDLAPRAVEELLRFESPVQLTSRVVQEELEVQGIRLPRGTTVHPMLGSANRDERAFDEPDRLDITREPGRHMAFGFGIHFCLGAPLARMEGEIAFRTLARHAPDLQLASEQVTWRPGAVLHGLRELPVRFGS